MRQLVGIGQPVLGEDREALDLLDARQPCVGAVDAGLGAMWGTGEVQHVLYPDMPWNEAMPDAASSAKPGCRVLQ